MDSFVPRSLVRLQIRCQVALQTYESLGCFQAYGRSASMAHSHGWKVGAGCGLGGCNFFPHGPLLWAAGGSLQHGSRLPTEQSIPERGRQTSQCAYSLDSEVMHRHFLRYFGSWRPGLVSYGRRWHVAVNTRSQGSWGTIPVAGYHMYHLSYMEKSDNEGQVRVRVYIWDCCETRKRITCWDPLHKRGPLLVAWKTSRYMYSLVIV